jgi:hypothetical protein
MLDGSIIRGSDGLIVVGLHDTPGKKDVKNEGCSQRLIENKGAKKVLPMS